MKSFTSSQKPSRTSGNDVLEDRPGEEGLAHHRPAGAGQDQRGEAAEHDDASRRPRSPARAAPGGACAASRSSAAVADDGGLGHAARIMTSAGDGAASCDRRLVELGRAGASLIQLLLDLCRARRSSAARRSPARRRRSAASPSASSAPHWSPPGAGNWPTIGRVGHLDGGQVERRRQVDDDRVDLAVLERGDDVVGVVEDLRLARRARSRRSTASRLVVPIWTPILASLQVGQRWSRSAASESLSATTAWLAV